MARSVCIVSPGNLAANPRILKEADALHEAGYAVTAVVSDYSTGLRGFDAEIAGRVPWKVVRAQRSPAERYVSAAARLAARVTDELGEQSSPAVAARAYGGPIGPLQRAALAVPADLYIGHYIAGLHAAGVAARQHQAKLGFDAEDFHPGEERDDLRTEIVRVVEAEWLPRCRHFTAAAPLIGKAYAERYGLAQPATVLNVFPLGMASRQAAAPRPVGAPLRAYWFSQTIGLDRGLQPFLQGIANARTRVELELRGDDRWGHGATLLALARNLGIGDRLKLLPMGAPEEMVRLAAAYDLGLSLETDVSENRQLCLTNKIFTYLLAGVPVVMSDTLAQRQIAPDLGAAAALVSLSDPPAIAGAIDRLAAGLDVGKAQAATLGRERYNWDVEKKTLSFLGRQSLRGGLMPTLKQRLGAWAKPRLPVNPWVFMTIRVESNAMLQRMLNRILPSRLAQRRALQRRRDVLVNIGCGPFGKEGWVNLDLFPAPGVTMRVDARWGLPLADGAARGIHVEHYFEHLEPTMERPRFLADCRRCLQPGGILRIVVPDMRKYIEAYLAPGWDMLNQVGCGGERPQDTFATKIEALNHVFVQDGEHYGGFDADYLRNTLAKAGFDDIEQVDWRTGRFPGGAIDREQHASYSLYMEARR